MTGITCSQVSALIECEQKAQFELIGLNVKSPALLTALRSVLSVFVENMATLKQDELKQKLHTLIIDSINEECVNFPRVLQDTRERYCVLFDGFIDRAYAKYKEYGQIETNVKFTYSFPGSFRGKAISGITDVIALLFKSKDKVLGVSLHIRKNPYSDRGRKITSTTHYSPNLLFKYLYLKEHSEKQVNVEDWYLLPDGNTVDPDLTHGKRIATYKYDDLSSSECFERLANEPLGAKRCENCPYSSLCKAFSRRVREGRRVDDEKVSHVDFTPAQQEAINFGKGVCEVIAIAGSGKTKAIVQRTLRLIKAGVDPKRILLFAFTKKAAGEMSSRIGQESGTVVTTEHAFAFDLIQSNAVYFGKNFRMAEVGDREEVIRQVLNKVPLIPDLNYEVDGIYSACAMADKYFTFYSENGEDDFRNHYSRFSKQKLDALCELCLNVKNELSARGFMSYDDMIPFVVQAFRRNPNFLSMIAARYDYIMVDEFQDTSQDQYELITLLAHHIGNLMVVGDDDQSIYGFRGGDSGFFNTLRTEFPETRIIKFDNNFRSSSEICDTASKIVEDIDGRIEKNITGRGSGGNLPIYYKNSDPRLLLMSIQKLLKTRRASDICVLTRNNAEAKEVHEILESADIRSTVPKDFLKDDAVFNIIYDLLNYYLNDDDFSLYRLLYFLGIINFPRKVNHNETYSFNLMSLGISNPIIDRALEKIDAAIEAIDADGNLSFTLSKIGKAIGLPQKHPVYNALVDLCVQKDAASLFGPCSLFSVMSDIIKYKDEQRVGYEPTPGEIQIFTAHDAKGLQFDAVCIWRTEMFDYDKEDRNLMYVASTRAKNLLIYMEGPESEKGPYRGLSNIEPTVSVMSWH